MNAILGRDFFKSALEKRALEDNTRRRSATIGLPDLLKANVRVVFATLWVAPCPHDDLWESRLLPCYETPQEAHEQAREQLAYYVKLATDPRIILVRTRSDLDRALNPIEDRVGLVLLMEGADPLITPREAKTWFDEGLRIIAPAWKKTRYAGGTGAPGPLTAYGRELMLEMERAGLILDVSHLADDSFSEALDLFHGPVLASHSNCREYVPTDRHLSDEMISALVKRDGVIGIALYNGFLQPTWKNKGGMKSQVTLLDVVKHIQHVCAIAGDTLHAAIGSDFDGGFGTESIPAELDTVADLQQIGLALKATHASDMDVGNILGGNWLRLLRRALPL
jgi:membrane dipeptidase